MAKAKGKVTRTKTNTAKQAAHGQGNAITGSAVASAPVNNKPQVPAAGAVASAPVMDDKTKK